MAKHELVRMDSKLITTHTVIGSDQSLLQVADRAVWRWRHGFRDLTQFEFAKAWLRGTCLPSFAQPSEGPTAVGVYGSTWCPVLFKKAIRVVFLKSGITAIRARPSGTATFLDCHKDQRPLRSLRCRLPRRPAWVTANPPIVYFHFAPYRLASDVDHSPPEFVEHHTCCFVVSQAKLALQK
jgi:hypothetical protein